MAEYVFPNRTVQHDGTQNSKCWREYFRRCQQSSGCLLRTKAAACSRSLPGRTLVFWKRFTAGRSQKRSSDILSGEKSFSLFTFAIVSPPGRCAGGVRAGCHSNSRPGASSWSNWKANMAMMPPRRWCTKQHCLTQDTKETTWSHLS